MTKKDRQLLALVVAGLTVGVGIGLALALPPLPEPAKPVVPRAAPSPVAPIVEVLPDLVAAARAYGAIGDVLDRDRFTLRSVRCWPEADYWLCAVCASGPKHELGATLVKCDQWRCYWPLDVSEYERLGWNGEEQCVIREGEQ